MVGPMDLRAFEKLVKSYGCRIDPTTKHHVIVHIASGKKVLQIAIRHKKGAKISIKPIYVRNFLAAMGEI